MNDFKKCLKNQNDFTNYVSSLKLSSDLGRESFFIEFYDRWHNDCLKRIDKNKIKLFKIQSIYYQNLLYRQNKKILDKLIENNSMSLIEDMLRCNNYDDKYLNYILSKNKMKITEYLNKVINMKKLNRELEIKEDVQTQIIRKI